MQENELVFTYIFEEMKRIIDIGGAYMSNNYIKLKKWSLFYQYYFYIDYADNAKADQIFIDNHVPVKFKGDYIKDGTPYMCVICKVPKYDAERFEKCLAQLSTICKEEYAEFCNEFWGLAGGTNEYSYQN